MSDLVRFSYAFPHIADKISESFDLNDFKNASLICTAWNQFSNDWFLKNTTININIENVDDLVFLSRIHNKFEVNDVSIEQTENFFEHLMTMQAFSGKHLKKVELKDLHLSVNSLYFLARLVHIDNLTIHSCSVDTTFFKVSRFFLDLNELECTMISANDRQFCNLLLSHNKATLKKIRLSTTQPDRDEKSIIEETCFPKLVEISVDGECTDLTKFFTANPQLKNVKMEEVSVPEEAFDVLKANSVVVVAVNIKEPMPENDARADAYLVMNAVVRRADRLR